MIVQIKKVDEASKGDNHWKVITYEKDGQEKQKAIFLKDKYDLLIEGATVDLVMKKNEANPKYWDVTDIKPATLGEAVKTEEKAQYTFKYFEQMSMNRRTALMQSVQFWATLEPDKELNGADVRLGILQTAESFVNWLEKGDIPTGSPNASPVEAEGPFKPDDKATVATTIKNLKELSPTDEVIPMKTIGDLLNACHKEFGMTRAQVYKILEVTDGSEIKNLPAAYLKIAAAKKGAK